VIECNCGKCERLIEKIKQFVACIKEMSININDLEDLRKAVENTDCVKNKCREKSLCISCLAKKLGKKKYNY